MRKESQVMKETEEKKLRKRRQAAFQLRSQKESLCTNELLRRQATPKRKAFGVSLISGKKFLRGTEHSVRLM